MNTTVINIETNQKTKDQAQKIANEMGLSLSTVIEKLLKQFIKTKSVTFTQEYEIPNDHTRAILKEAKEDYKKGNTSPRFKKMEDFISYLHQKAA